MTSQNDNQEDTITLRIRGMGHSLEMHFPSQATTHDLQTNIEHLTGLATAYQRIIIKGKTITATEAGDDASTTTLSQLGLSAGSISKGMLMCTPAYKADQKALEQIKTLNNELDMVLQRKQHPDKMEKDILSNGAVSELITSICCKLDAVDVSGSSTLRDMRKKVLHRAEEIDRLWEDDES